MARLGFLVTQDKPETKQCILDFYLEKANTFRAYFPGGEELSGSRPDFLALEGVSAQPWSGMMGCIVVEDALSPAAIALIRERGNFQEDGSYHPLQLWSYELVDNSEVLLRIADFSVWLVFATPDELQSLEQQGILVNNWQELNLKSEEGVTPLPMDEAALKQLVQAIEAKFLPPRS